jgi:hypothetical protein
MDMGGVNDESRHDEEHLVDLLAELREPPRHWIDAAEQLPEARRSLVEIVARAEADAAYREQVLADLERALRETGREPAPQLVASLRARLAEPDA